MTNALAIDTTSEVLSLGLMKDGRCVAQHYEAVGREMNRSILSVIDRMLVGAELDTEALQLIVAARGPGSFTGTRIGLAMARSFAQVCGLPLVGVDTLRLLAAQAVTEPGGAIHAVLNCTRDEVYHAAYRWGGAGLEPLGEIRMTTFANLPEIIGDAPVVLRRFKTERTERPGQPGHETALATLRRAVLQRPAPDATLLLEQGLGLFQAGAPWPVAEPIYLKSEAFRKWKA